MKGEKTPGSGRKAGTPNKTTRELRELAQQYGPDSLAFYVRVRDDESLPIMARLYAADKLLDRGYGKASRTIELHRSVLDYDNMSVAELTARAQQVLSALAERNAEMHQLPAESVVEAEEIVDGGVVIPDAEPQGSYPVGIEPNGEKVRV